MITAHCLSTIECMLVCYYSPDPIDEIGAERWSSPPFQNAVKFLHAHNLIGTDLTATAKGAAWVEALRDTPLPVPKWVVEREVA